MKSYNLTKCSREMFTEAIVNSDKKLDSFARTFIRKADMQNMWEHCVALVNENNNVCSAIITTYSKREPKVANLQLLHTFNAYRKQGHAAILCKASIENALKNNCKYYRVSAEPSAVEFYKKIGFKFLGEQKSKCQLSMFRFDEQEIVYDIEDTIINKAVYKKGKGGCIKIF